MDAAAVFIDSLAAEKSGCLQTVRELGQAASTDRDVLGEICHSNAPSGRATDRPEDVVPRERRQVRVLEGGLHAGDERRMSAEKRLPRGEMGFR